LLRNVYNKNAYLSGNGVKTSPVSAETNKLTTTTPETVKLKDSTRCLLDRPTDGYNRYREKQTRARRRAEQIRASKTSRAKKTPDRRGPKQTEEPSELAELEKNYLKSKTVSQESTDRQTVKGRDTARLRTIK
jgi:hypothetical protein